jgi:hypothetical protein
MSLCGLLTSSAKTVSEKNTLSSSTALIFLIPQQSDACSAADRIRDTVIAKVDTDSAPLQGFFIKLPVISALFPEIFFAVIRPA